MPNSPAYKFQTLLKNSLWNFDDQILGSDQLQQFLITSNANFPTHPLSLKYSFNVLLKRLEYFTKSRFLSSMSYTRHRKIPQRCKGLWVGCDEDVIEVKFMKMHRSAKVMGRQADTDREKEKKKEHKSVWTKNIKTKSIWRQSQILGYLFWNATYTTTHRIN